MQRFLLGNASFVELDEKGRFLVPSYLKEHASLMTDVVFAGLHRFVELWDVKLWEEEQSLLREKLPSVATRLTEKERNDE
jgi:MraZ protein